VKKNRRDELFLSITESKKVFVGEVEDGQFNFEKHKIFLYKEDFSKFIDALSNAIRFIHENGDLSSLPSDDPEANSAFVEDEDQTPSDEEPNESIEPVSDEKTGEIADEIDLKIDF
jgi:hypothetical protein